MKNWNWREEHTVFPRKKKTAEPENSTHVGTCATSPLSNVTLIFISIIARGAVVKRGPDGAVAATFSWPEAEPDENKFFTR